jgi:hypothetical protein
LILTFIAGFATALALCEVRDRIRQRKARETLHRLIAKYKEHLKGQ